MENRLDYVVKKCQIRLQKFCQSKIDKYNFIKRLVYFPLGVSETDTFCLHVCPSLQDFDKLYGRLIAYLIFEIDFNTRLNYQKVCYYLL